MTLWLAPFFGAWPHIVTPYAIIVTVVGLASKGYKLL